MFKPKYQRVYEDDPDTDVPLLTLCHFADPGKLFQKEAGDIHLQKLAKLYTQLIINQTPIKLGTNTYHFHSGIDWKKNNQDKSFITIGNIVKQRCKSEFCPHCGITKKNSLPVPKQEFAAYLVKAFRNYCQNKYPKFKVMSSYSPKYPPKLKPTDPDIRILVMIPSK